MSDLWRMHIQFCMWSGTIFCGFIVIIHRNMLPIINTPYRHLDGLVDHALTIAAISDDLLVCPSHDRCIETDQKATVSTVQNDVRRTATASTSTVDPGQHDSLPDRHRPCLSSTVSTTTIEKAMVSTGRDGVHPSQPPRHRPPPTPTPPVHSTACPIASTHTDHGTNRRAERIFSRSENADFRNDPPGFRQLS